MRTRWLAVGLFALFIASGAVMAHAAPSDSDVTRLAGADRYATSAAISAASFAPGAPVAYIANGLNFPDALSGAAAAGHAGGPVLLTAATGLPDPIKNELTRLKPAKIIVLGGPTVVHEAVLTQLDAYTSGTVTRLAGADRYATSAAISAASFAPGAPVAYIANGLNFPDALSGAAAAGHAGGPVLLTAATGLPDPIKNELTRLKPAKIIVLGGPTVVHEAVLTQLDAYTSGTVTRLAGADRYATSAAISAASFAPGAPVAYIANGLNFPDALSGAAAAGHAGGPVLLTAATGLPDPIKNELTRLKPAKIIVLGGPTVLHEAVLTQRDAYSAGDGSAGPLTVRGTLASDTTWSASTTPVVVVYDTLRVPEGVTLTIGEGVVVKFAYSDNPDWAFGSIEVNGRLEIAGTPSAPVIMTTIFDDTAGGDTNGDGSASDAAQSRWWGITVQRGGSLDIVHLEQRHGDGLVHFTAPGGDEHTSIVDSVFSGNVQWGPVDGGPFPSGWNPTFTFTGNTIRDGRLHVAGDTAPTTFAVRDNVIDPGPAGPAAISISASEFRPSWITGNRTRTSGTIVVNGTLKEDWIVTTQGGLGWGVAISLNVPSGIDMTIPAGTVMGSGLITVAGGNLSIPGTKDAPVVLRNLDRETGGWGGIVVERDGTLTATFLDLRTDAYGESISIGYGNRIGQIRVWDSTLAGAVDANCQCHDATGMKISLVRNTLRAGPLKVIAFGSPAATVEVRDNRVQSVASDQAAFTVRIGELDPALVAGNVSDNPSSFILAGTIGRDWTLPSWPNLSISPGLTARGAQLTVPAGMTLRSGYVGAYQGGSVRAVGTPTQPIVLENVDASASSGGTLIAQHVRFNTVETDNAWGESTVAGYDGGTLLLDDVVFGGKPGGACVTVNEGVAGHLRGSVAGCMIGVDGGNRTTPFDATEVDWGSPDGPPPLGSGAEARGAVAVTPWIGFVEPVLAPTPEPPPPRPSCVDNLIIAVRGSGEVPNGTVDVATDPELYDHFTYAEMTAGPWEFRGLGDRVQAILTGQMRMVDGGQPVPGTIEDHAVGLLDLLAARDPASVEQRVRVEPLIYPAAPTELITTQLSPLNFTTYLSSMSWGMSWLESEISGQVRDCPDQDLVLVGYSQGALVIQMALADMAAQGETAKFDAIDAVLLLANPLQDPASDGYAVYGGMAGGANQSIGYIQSLVDQPVIGSFVKWLYDNQGVSGMVEAMQADYPDSIAGRTLTYCNVGDQLCAPQGGMSNEEMGRIHGAYTADELAGFGRESIDLFAE